MPAFLAALLVALLGVVVLDTSPSSAQGACNQTSSREDFTLTPNLGTFLPFPAPSVSDFTATWTIMTRTFTLHVDPRKKNKAWDLCIRAQDAAMLNGKPAGDLEWRLAGTSVWYPMTTSYAQVVQNTGTHAVSIEFRIRLYWESDAPASYSSLFTVAVL